MSATTATGPAGPAAAGPGAIDLGDTTAVPMARLAAVELRKALDTRAGRWFTISILVLVLAVQVIYAFAAPEDAGARG